MLPLYERRRPTIPSCSRSHSKWIGPGIGCSCGGAGSGGTSKPDQAQNALADSAVPQLSGHMQVGHSVAHHRQCPDLRLQPQRRPDGCARFPRLRIPGDAEHDGGAVKKSFKVQCLLRRMTKDDNCIVSVHDTLAKPERGASLRVEARSTRSAFEWFYASVSFLIGMSANIER